MNNLNERLLELAHQRAESQRQVKNLRDQAQLLLNQAHQIEEDLETSEYRLKQDLQAHIEATGDYKIHPAVHYVRHTSLQYDRADALRWAQENARSFLRVKEELIVKDFEAAVENGEIDYFGAERAPAPYVRIDKLGDLLLTEKTDEPDP